MIASLTGQVTQVGPTWVVLDVSGVGFLVLCTPTTSAALRTGATASLHTHLAVREDALTLYGFGTPDEREAFQIVQSATGVGPKIALAMVATLTPTELRRAVLSQDLVALSKVPGVGNKVAQRLCLELKDKVLALGDDTTVPEVRSDSPHHLPVVEGLESLGYSSRDAEAAWDGVSELAKDESVTVSHLMKAALRSLARS